MQVIAPRFDGGSGPVFRNRTALETASKLTLRPDRAGLAASTPGSIAWLPTRLSLVLGSFDTDLGRICFTWNVGP
jgi:hypothetical protein